jgi:hypothetical protein
MSETFDQWWQSLIEKHKVSAIYPEKDNVRAAWEHQQTKLDAQAEEIAALRETLRCITDFQTTKIIPDAIIIHILKQGGIIDADGNPTTLLTGEKE